MKTKTRGRKRVSGKRRSRFQPRSIEFEKRLHYFTALGFFDEKADFSKIVATAKTSATKELEKVLSSNRSFKTGGADNFRKESKNDLLKSLNQFNKDK